jgi:hypothetical protein
LHDHAHYLGYNPNMSRNELLPTLSPPPVLPAPSTPANPAAGAEWARFRVVDVVPALPAGLWDSEVVSTYEFCKTADGMFVRVRSPLGIVLESAWRVQEGKAGGALVMVEEVTMIVSSLLAPILRAQCEKNWRGIHQRLLAPLSEGEDGKGGDVELEEGKSGAAAVV